VAGEGAATGAELYVGHGTVWVNGDNGYIAMQVSGLEAFLGAGLTDSGKQFSRLARRRPKPKRYGRDRGLGAMGVDMKAIKNP
jgi:hypothetical protein